MSHLRILIAGSRTINNYTDLLRALNDAISNAVIQPSGSYEIVSGGARGVDELAKRYANDCGYKYTEMKPIYQNYNDRGAPLRRNIDMAHYADVLIAVWDGNSNGTKHMIGNMKKLNKPVYVHIVK